MVWNKCLIGVKCVNSRSWLVQLTWFSSYAYVIMYHADPERILFNFNSEQHRCAKCDVGHKTALTMYVNYTESERFYFTGTYEDELTNRHSWRIAFRYRDDSSKVIFKRRFTQQAYYICHIFNFCKLPGYSHEEIISSTPKITIKLS